MKIAVLTGGGDCPGLNAVLRAIVRKATINGDTVVGIRDGWMGAISGDVVEVGIDQVRGILPRGGTILGSTGVSPATVAENLQTIVKVLSDNQVDVLIVIGGEGTLGGAHLLEAAGVNVVGVPKTIDNDLEGTDYTFGFDTAVNVATEAIDRLHTTAESHHRTLVVEVMGRNTGWIALHAGVAGGANGICIPEQPFDLDVVQGWVESRFAKSYAPVIVVAERAIPADPDLLEQHGTHDEFGSRYIPNIGQWMTSVLEQRTGHPSRNTVLGHVQRGGTPSAFDRELATRFGLAAVDAVTNKSWGQMVALRSTQIITVPLTEAIGSLKRVPSDRYAEVALLFG
ncbi:MAG: ATP-dependent 6-phosphofructokinase [Actinomycetes bacterium]